MENRQGQQLIGEGFDKHRVFDEIISPDNLFSAWYEFVRGKSKKFEVMEFARRLEDNIFCLYYKLKDEKYQHGAYRSFFVFDPKKRHIHKAPVADRLLHRAIVRVIEPVFERRFIFDSYSCRSGKGTQAALERFRDFGWRLSQNNTKTIWVLKGDVRSFFDTVDHDVLMELLASRVRDERALRLLGIIVNSFSPSPGEGLPLGNLTSQLFANIYLNELDYFAKMELRAKHYLRYCDDFVIFDRNKTALLDGIKKIDEFLHARLKLEIHPRKVSIRKLHRGVDFLGFISWPHFRILRTKTERRILRKLGGDLNKNAFISYLGLVKRSRSRGLKLRMIRRIV